MRNHELNEGNQTAKDSLGPSSPNQVQKTNKRLTSGDVLDGTIKSVKEEAIFVDVGASYDAVIPQKDFKKLDQDTLEGLSPGDSITVCIKHVPTRGGNPFASIGGHADDGSQADKEVDKDDDWQRAKTYLQSGEALKLKISKQNRGGLIAMLGSLEGFIPNSHLPSLPQGGYTENATELKKQKVGTIMPLRVIEVNRDKNRLILSARNNDENIAEKNDVLENLKVGQTVSGQVVNLVDFGAFVDLGSGVNGLIHISELAWQHLEHPSELLQVGDDVEVKVQKIDLSRNRISLSRKVLCSNPWASIEERYQKGDLVEGVITTVRKFGAFVRLAAGVEGLLHKSETQLSPGMELKDMLQPGQEVLLRITNIDPNKERIGLSQQKVSLGERLSWTMHKKHEPPPQSENPPPGLDANPPTT